MVNDQGKKAIGGAVPLRFVQIATATEGDSQGMESTLYGLTADGQVYTYMSGRSRLKEPRDAINYAGQPYKDQYGPLFSWWQPLRMSDEKGTEYEPPATPKEFL